MRGSALYGIALLCCAQLSPRLTAAAVPLEVYGRLPSLEDVALSPSGSRIAFVRTTHDTRIIAVVSLADNKVLTELRVGEQKLRSIDWADESHLLIVTSMTALPWGFIGKQIEWRLLQVYNVDSHKSYPVPGRDIRKADNLKLMNVISGALMIRRVEGHSVLFVPGIYAESEALPALFRVDLDTGVQSLIRKGSSPTERWLVDTGGEIVAEQDYNQQAQHWKLKIRRDGRLQEVASGKAALEFPEFLGFGPTPDTLLMQSLEGDQPVWRLLSLKDGTLGPPMDERRTLSEPIEDQLTSRMIGGVQSEDDVHYVFFEPAMQARWDSITAAFEGERVRLVSAAAGFNRFIVQVNGAKHGYLYELIDLATHAANTVGEVYEGITTPLEVRKFAYAAADGLQIPAYLTLPHERA